jgi:hypothetical protein
MSVLILMILHRSVRSNFLAVALHICNRWQHGRVVYMSYVDHHILKQLFGPFLLLQHFLMFQIIFNDNLVVTLISPCDKLDII